MCSIWKRPFSHLLPFCSSRLLFSPNPILNVLCGNRFHGLQNKWKHSLCGPRDNYPCLRSLDVMPQTTVATIPGHGQLLLKKTSLLLFQKWFPPAFLDSSILYSPLKCFLYLIPLERRRNESLNPRLAWSLYNSELFLGLCQAVGHSEEAAWRCLSLYTEREGWGASLHLVSGPLLSLDWARRIPVLCGRARHTWLCDHVGLFLASAIKSLELGLPAWPNKKVWFPSSFSC